MLASAGSSIKFWDLQSFKLIQELSSASKHVSGISWNKDGHILASFDKKISEISTHTVSSSTAICSGIFHIMDNVGCLQFCNTTKHYMAVGGCRDRILIWDVKGNAQKKSFTVNQTGIQKVSFSATDSHLVAGMSGGSAFILSNTNNLVTGPVKIFTEKTKVMDIRFNYLNRFLVGACGENGAVAFLDTFAGKVVKEFCTGHTAPSTCLAFSPINELLMVTVGYDKKFVCYNSHSKSVAMFRMMPAPLTSLAFLNNGQCIAMGTITGHVYIYDLRVLNTPLADIDAHQGPVLDLKVQPLGKAQPKTPKVPKCQPLTSVTEGSMRADIASQGDIQSEKADNLGTRITNVEVHTSNLGLLSPIGNKANHNQNGETKDLWHFSRTPSKDTEKGFEDVSLLSSVRKENKGPGQSILKKGLFVEGILSPQADQNASSGKTEATEGQRQNSFDARGKRTDDFGHLDDLRFSPAQSSFAECEEAPLSSLDTNICVQKINDGEQKSDSDFHIPKSDDEIHNLCSPVSEYNESWHPVASPHSSSWPPRNIDSDQRATTRFSEDDVASPDLERKATQEREMALQEQNKSERAGSFIRDEEAADCEETSRSKDGDNRSQEAIRRTVGASSINERETGLEGTLSIKQLSLDQEGSIRPDGGVTADQSGKDADAYLLAFPSASDATSDEPEPRTRGASPQRISESAGNATQMNLRLVESCVADVIERHEFNVNKRLMHLNYVINKRFYCFKHEMMEALKEISLNEELLAENKRLREEVQRLKCIY